MTAPPVAQPCSAWFSQQALTRRPPAGGAPCFCRAHLPAGAPRLPACIVSRPRHRAVCPRLPCLWWESSTRHPGGSIRSGHDYAAGPHFPPSVIRSALRMHGSCQHALATHASCPSASQGTPGALHPPALQRTASWHPHRPAWQLSSRSLQHSASEAVGSGQTRAHAEGLNARTRCWLAGPAQLPAVADQRHQAAAGRPACGRRAGCESKPAPAADRSLHAAGRGVRGHGHRHAAGSRAGGGGAGWAHLAADDPVHPGTPAAQAAD